MQAFSLYSYETAIYQIFTNQARHPCRHYSLHCEWSVLHEWPHDCQHAALLFPQLLNLKGLGWIYQQSIFMYMMYGIVGLSFAFFAIKGPEPFKRRKAEDIYKD